MNENYKGKLQEYCQSQGLPFPKYGIVTQSGPPHCLEFEVSVQSSIVGFRFSENCVSRLMFKSVMNNLLEIMSAERRKKQNNQQHKWHVQHSVWSDRIDL